MNILFLLFNYKATFWISKILNLKNFEFLNNFELLYHCVCDSLTIFLIEMTTIIDKEFWILVRIPHQYTSQSVNCFGKLS